MRKNIKKSSIQPKSYNKNIPKISVRPGENLKLSVNSRHAGKKINITRTFRKKTPEVSKPINFLVNEFTKTKNEICFVIGGGPSLNGFDFNQLNGYDTIAVNKAAEYVPNPTYFITTDYSYFIKASLPLDELKQKCTYTYFVANMGHPYMKYENGKVVDTRRNFVYEDLYKYTGVIESYSDTGFGLNLNEFSNGKNSGHCGIQLALLLGYKKIYLLGFDLNSDGQSHFHQSYREVDQKSFKNRVNGYAETLTQALAEYKGTQQIINLSSSSILTNSPTVIKTETFKDVLEQQGEFLGEVINEDNSTLDNLMVVGYYTVNTPYEEEAQNLLQSLNKLKVNHDIIGVKTLGNWQANTRFKAGFMLDMLIKWPNHRLLYVDVDAVVHKSPDLFKNYSCDIAV